MIEPVPAMFAPALLIGSTYALLAVGYAVAFSSINMINFAHGEVLMIGALFGYLVLEAGTSTGMGGAPLFALAIVVGGMTGAGVAYLVQRLLYRPVRKRGRLALVLVALGTSMFLQQAAFLALRTQGSGSSERRLPLLREPTTVLFGCSLSELSGVVLLVASASILAWLMRHTLFGIRLRAIGFSPEALKRLKQPADVTISQAFAIGGFVAGAAGVVFAKQYTLTPFMGILPGMKAFLACVVGGRSIFGAVIGGFVIGAAEGLISGWLGTDWRDIASGLLIIIILVFRPDGIIAAPRPRSL